MIDDKQKMLYLMRLLREETDPAHPIRSSFPSAIKFNRHEQLIGVVNTALKPAACKE